MTVHDDGFDLHARFVSTPALLPGMYIVLGHVVAARPSRSGKTIKVTTYSSRTGRIFSSNDAACTQTAVFTGADVPAEACLICGADVMEDRSCTAGHGDAEREAWAAAGRPGHAFDLRGSPPGMVLSIYKRTSGSERRRPAMSATGQATTTTRDAAPVPALATTSAAGGGTPDVSAPLTPRGRQGGRDVRANPTNSKGRYVETREYIAAARRFIRGAGRRVADMDLDEAADLADLVDEANLVLDAAMLRLHDECGYSWGDIGARLGVTRQAVFRKFSVNGRRRLGHAAGPA